jgi:hypothetical protein
VKCSRSRTATSTKRPGAPAGLIDELKDQYRVGQATIRRVLSVEPTQGTTIVDPSATTETLATVDRARIQRLRVQRIASSTRCPGTGWGPPPTKRFDIRGARGHRGVGRSTAARALRRRLGAERTPAARRSLRAYFDVANAREVAARSERHGVVVLVPDDWSTSTQFLNVISNALQSTRSCVPVTSRRSSTFLHRT